MSERPDMNDPRGVTELLFQAADNELDSSHIERLRRQIESCQDSAREAAYIERFLTVVKSRCGRQAAPTRLRLKILSSFDHRQGR
jgi:anti-sigma factor (TIGR02949 family)